MINSTLSSAIKHILATLLILNYSPTPAQVASYNDGDHWTTVTWGWTVSESHAHICGDTIIHNKDYKILRTAGLPDLPIRIDGQKVWKFCDDQDNLLYDFSLEVGDIFSSYTCNGNYNEDLVVEEVEYIEIEGVNYKKITFSGSFSEYWIEGIGSKFDFGREAPYGFDNAPALCCFVSQDVQYFSGISAEYCSCQEDSAPLNSCNNTASGLQTDSQLDDAIHLYPNPSSDHFKIKHPYGGLIEVRIYDSESRLVSTQVLDRTNEEVSVSNLSSGLFYVQIKSLQDVKLKKIVVLNGN